MSTPGYINYGTRGKTVLRPRSKTIYALPRAAFDLNQFAFSAAAQLMTTVSGGCEVSSATGVFTKNR